MRLQKFYLPIFLFFGLTILPCETTSYIGDNLSPTNHIDVFYAAKDIKREYKVIGHISAISENKENRTKVALMKKAKAVGADGIIILGRDFTRGKETMPVERADAIKYVH